MIIAEVGVVLLYLAITLYGSFMLTGVVEEKSSRVVEVLLSRVPPSSLLGGKITGIGLAGLVQFAAVAAAAAATLLVTRPSGLPPGTYSAIPMLVVWFVLGYAFYSTLYGSLGSLASRAEDAQAAAGPVIALMLGIYVAAVVLMLAGTYGLFLAGARLYRNAVMRTGARLRISEAWHGEPARPQPARR